MNVQCSSNFFVCSLQLRGSLIAVTLRQEHEAGFLVLLLYHDELRSHSIISDVGDSLWVGPFHPRDLLYETNDRGRWG